MRDFCKNCSCWLFHNFSWSFPCPFLLSRSHAVMENMATNTNKSHVSLRGVIYRYFHFYIHLLEISQFLFSLFCCFISLFLLISLIYFLVELCVFVHIYLIVTAVHGLIWDLAALFKGHLFLLTARLQLRI